ncbi:MAG: hypothetical protein LGB78_05105 [Sulfurovum sp.]|nr:hypothetical protein [Sulfurovum sp.]MCB4784391.1 hypothetical protein [Sulfurovum sp.]
MMEFDQNLFGDNIDFLQDIMWLDLMDIQQEVEKNHEDKKKYFCQLFTLMNNKYKYFNQKFKNTSIEYHKDISSEIFDSIPPEVIENYIAIEMYHIYRSFCRGGIEDAWLYSQHEEWYPKIIFRERINSDISILGIEEVIYRGTRIEEYESKSYGQSWSLDKNIAKKFAYSQYKHTNSSHGDRVVLRAVINIKDVLYYKKNTTAKENEVIVDSKKLKNVELVSHSHPSSVGIHTSR